MNLVITKLAAIRTEEIISLIRHNKRISRVQLSKMTGLSKPTISLIVNQLIEEGVVRETGVGEAERLGGRKPIQLSFVHDYRLSISVDIGGTKTLVSVIDLQGRILESLAFSSQQSGGFYEVIERIISISEDYIDKYGKKRILGMIIGIPGVVEKSTYLIKYMPAFNLSDVDLKPLVEERLGVPVLAENDVTLAAFGEVWAGAAKDLPSVLLVSVGTGIGAGIIVDGKVYTGQNGIAGEIGEMVTDWTKEASFNKGFGRIEKWLSGHSLESYILENSLNADVAMLFSMIDDNPQINERITEGCSHLGLALANAVVMLDPYKVLIAGGIGYNQYERLHPILDSVLKAVLPESMYRKDLLGKASLDPYGVIIGGAYLVQQELLMKCVCKEEQFATMNNR